MGTTSNPLGGQARHLIVSPAVQLTASEFLANAAPLLEEEWYECPLTLLVNGFDPGLLHESRPWAGFAAYDDPMDAIET